MAIMNMASYSGAELDYTIQEKWNKRAFIDMIYQSVTTRFEGGDFPEPEKAPKPYKAGQGKYQNIVTGMPIAAIENAWNDGSDTMHIQVAGELFGSGKTNDSTLEGSEEPMSYGQYSFSPTLYRHATAYNRFVNFLSYMNNRAMAARLLTAWGARKLDALMFQEMLHTASPNVVFAGNASEETSMIAGGNTLTVDDLYTLKAMLEDQGAPPISVYKEKKAKGMPASECPEYMAFVSSVDAYNLKKDNNWKQFQFDAANRGALNPLFTGAIGNIDGLYLFVLPAPTQGSVRIGNPLRPETALYSTLAESGTTATVAVDSSKDATIFFPSSGNLIVYNASGEMIEVMSYSGKTANTFTGLTRGVQGTDQEHAAGTKISLSYGSVVGMGARSVIRAYGERPRLIDNTRRDYDHEIGHSINFIVGHKAVQDSAGNVKNYAQLKTFSSKPYGS